ncbi:MAG: PleD family two-component system response regulator [Pseudomonadota bacterium]
MSARVLVVDDVLPNVKLLEAKLKTAYYTVLTALSGAEALEIARRERPDLILLDVMMPGMDGYECCTRLKADPELADIPVVMVTALDQASDRVRGLEAGADDFLTKPPHPDALLARVRSLVRLKSMIDELRMRDGTFRSLGMDEGLSRDTIQPQGHVLIIDNKARRAQRLQRVLSERLGVQVHATTEPEAALSAARRGAPDLFLVAHQLDGEDGLRLCSALRAMPETKQSSLILQVEHDDFKTVATSLDLGANDYIMRPIDDNELTARVRTQLLRKNYADRLRTIAMDNMRLAVTDELTGLYNRRYFDQHLDRQFQRVAETGTPLSLMVLDIDRFKRVNDTFGHHIGDEVLIEFANRIREATRGIDLVARYGGEEFVVMMPETDAEAAMFAAERVRKSVADRPFALSDPRLEPLEITVSLGVAEFEPKADSARSLYARADAALYRSKNEGRNRATLAGRSEVQVA